MVKKTLFKNINDDFHFGMNAPDESYSTATLDDLKKALTKLGKKKLWRCRVCHDLQLGTIPPHECPTCHTLDSYELTNLDEFKKTVGL